MKQIWILIINIELNKKIQWLKNWRWEKKSFKQQKKLKRIKKKTPKNRKKNSY